MSGKSRDFKADGLGARPREPSDTELVAARKDIVLAVVTVVVGQALDGADVLSIVGNLGGGTVA